MNSIKTYAAKETKYSKSSYAKNKKIKLMQESKTLGLNDKLSFGKYKNTDKTIGWICQNDGDYIRWIIKSKIQNIKFSDDVVINPFSTKRKIKVNHSRSGNNDFSYARDYNDNHFDLMGGGDYYPTGCDIYNLG